MMASLVGNHRADGSLFAQEPLSALPARSYGDGAKGCLLAVVFVFAKNREQARGLNGKAPSIIYARRAHLSFAERDRGFARCPASSATIGSRLIAL
jgi:hypothetical protein